MTVGNWVRKMGGNFPQTTCRNSAKQFMSVTILLPHVAVAKYLCVVILLFALVNWLNVSSSIFATC